MRYAVARCHQKQRDDAYRLYLSECLRILTENTAKTVSILGRGRVECHYMTAFEGKKEEENTVSPGEPIKRIREKLRSGAVD